MSEWNALSIRYMQLAVLSDANNTLITESDRQKAREELHLLRTIILDLPEDILGLVRLHVSL
ncbi:MULTISPECIES: hypothetical protein [unclassified Paenibacillus]|nr:MULTISPECIES: hypothetical protein [unclassified Paenibacillus]MDF9855034.1 hypothetical protein [Paenibacillus sp. PastF-1]MDH6480303.1 hypothetical protein [Paenibacillus sp. PastH-2]MDH6507713.1 hypothetical protein [Paenibacillus sp. PastM-3]MDF9841874.1 hypothetical protein [Paenibacillus sp. PastF-2]MDF9848445.1 hypothetical protein [Paenibacillus sp. PastM-2]